ncbi:sensor histidine kinase [Marinomonas atlantica]|uniref:sensor histidine kinase n=1 Tax=Marinomonas atlantica TaxID=1806668 RepID=UPI00083621F2|nr:HAMP domain-containing sensor histidine kinase [Marinomonas atlantica]
MNLKQISIFVLPLVIIVVLGVGTFRLWQTQYSEQLHIEQTELVNRGSVLMSRELGHIQQIVSYVGKVLEGYITPEQFESEQLWRQQVAQYFTRAHALSTYISQLRWIGPTGRELVRVNTFNDDADIVASSELQDKSNRYYFIQGMAFDNDDVLLTPIDLNIEQGAIVEPYEITIRASYKLHNTAGKELGLLVVNYNLNYLFARLRAIQSNSNSLEMINAKGQWLLSEHPELEWTHLYGDILSSFTNTFPETWAEVEKSQSLGVSRLSDSRPFTSLPSYFNEELSGQPNHYFLSIVKQDVWQNKKNQMLFFIVFAGVIGYSFLTTVGVLLWRLEVQRRQHLQQIEAEKKQLEIAHEQLKESNNNLVMLQNELVEQGKLNSLGLMVAGVGHELNTPLGGIRLSLSSLQNVIKRAAHDTKAADIDVCNDMIDLAMQNLTRATDTVAQFKRITTNQMNPEPESFNVLNMLEDTLSPLSSVLKKYPSIDTKLKVEPSLIVTSSQGVMSQVIQNLLLNALEHAFDKGQPGTITIAAKQEEDFVIEVSDNGKGIRDDMLATIWEPFVTSGRGEQHTGLGLFMVHQWVTQLLNGHIEIANHKHGVRFTITVPNAKNPT